jgi:single-strand DNA-binding protein
MNNWNGIGRLVRDPELKFIPGKGTANCTFTLAVDDGFGDNKKTYFIPIVTWNKIAENAANYTHKGSLVAISGKIATRSYDNKEGKKVYITEIVANEVQYLDSKVQGNQNQSNQQSMPFDAFGGGNFEEDITPVDDGDMPF